MLKSTVQNYFTLSTRSMFMCFGQASTFLTLNHGEECVSHTCSSTYDTGWALHGEEPLLHDFLSPVLTTVLAQQRHENTETFIFRSM